MLLVRKAWLLLLGVGDSMEGPSRRGGCFCNVLMVVQCWQPSLLRKAILQRLRQVATLECLTFFVNVDPHPVDMAVWNAGEFQGGACVQDGLSLDRHVRANVCQYSHRVFQACDLHTVREPAVLQKYNSHTCAPTCSPFHQQVRRQRALGCC